MGILACAMPLDAQLSAVLNHVAGRPPEVEIRNDSALNLTAFAIRMEPVDQSAENPAPFVFFLDATVDRDRPMPLTPRGTYGIAVPARIRRAQAPESLYRAPIVTAGIFADGTTTGEASLIGRLVLRRCNMLQAVELARDMLSAAGRHNVPRAQLVGQFQQMADSMNHWYLPGEQQVGRSVYQSIVGKLMGLPDMPFGAAFPPTAFVEQELASLSQQRTVLMESQPALGMAVGLMARQ
jgi:hypothetical protein